MSYKKEIKSQICASKEKLFILLPSGDCYYMFLLDYDLRTPQHPENIMKKMPFQFPSKINMIACTNSFLYLIDNENELYFCKPETNLTLEKISLSVEDTKIKIIAACQEADYCIILTQKNNLYAIKNNTIIKQYTPTNITLNEIKSIAISSNRIVLLMENGNCFSTRSLEPEQKSQNIFSPDIQTTFYLIEIPGLKIESIAVNLYNEFFLINDGSCFSRGENVNGQLSHPTTKNFSWEPTSMYFKETIGKENITISNMSCDINNSFFILPNGTFCVGGRHELKDNPSSQYIDPIYKIKLPDLTDKIIDMVHVPAEVSIYLEPYSILRRKERFFFLTAGNQCYTMSLTKESNFTHLQPHFNFTLEKIEIKYAHNYTKYKKAALHDFSI